MGRTVTSLSRGCHSTPIVYGSFRSFPKWSGSAADICEQQPRPLPANQRPGHLSTEAPAAKVEAVQPVAPVAKAEPVEIVTPAAGIVPVSMEQAQPALVPTSRKSNPNRKPLISNFR